MGRILKRAAELQHEEPEAPSASGLSLHELEEIASEAGIDPRFLRRAAAELGTNPEPPSPSSLLAGAPVTVTLQRTMPGEVPEEAFERLVLEIQLATSLHGQPSLLGRTLTWRTDSPGNTRSLQIVVSSRGGVTQLHVEERLQQIAGGLFGGLLGGVGGGIGIGVGLPVGIEVLGSAAFTVAWPLGVLGLTYIGTRAIFRTVSRRRQRALQKLLDRLSAVVAEEAVQSPALEGSDAPAQLPEG